MNEKHFELAKELRHELHQHPELSYEEVWTCKRLQDFLKEHTSLEVRDRGRWFYAVYRSKNPDKPSIAFRADFDALPLNEVIDLPWGSKFPGKSHKCGHDGHAATLCALALELEEKGADRDVYLLFQHAEETAQGAIECVSIFDEKDVRIDEFFAYHNEGMREFNQVLCKKGPHNCASKGMSIHFVGKQSHASQPDRGNNPVYAMAELISSIPPYLDNDYKGIVLATVVNVVLGQEYAFGVNPGDGYVRLTIRGEYEEEMDALQAFLENTATELANKMGLKVSFDFCDVFPGNVNTPHKVDKIVRATEKLGLDFKYRDVTIRGSEDYGYFTKVVPGAMFVVGNGADSPVVHTDEYDFVDEHIKTVVSIFWELIQDETE